MKRLSEFNVKLTNYQLSDSQYIGFESNFAMDSLYKFALDNIDNCKLLDLNCLRLDLKHFCVVNNKSIKYHGINSREAGYNDLAKQKYPEYNECLLNQDEILNHIYDYTIFIDSDYEKFNEHHTILIPKLIKFTNSGKLIILIKESQNYTELIDHLKHYNLNFSINFSKSLNYLKIIIENEY